MLLKNLKSLVEAKDDTNNKLFKQCSFEWILDLLKDGVVYSYTEKKNIQNMAEDDANYWIALTTKRNSEISRALPEYGACEVFFDQSLLSFNNDLFFISFNAEWLDKRPSITKFITGGAYSNSKDYFKKNLSNIDFSNNDNFSHRFFSEYMNDDKTLDVNKLLLSETVDNIEDYIYNSNYVNYHTYLSSLGDDNELVLVKAPLNLVNDAITQIVVPRRYKDKIAHFEREYKIRYE